MSHASDRVARQLAPPATLDRLSLDRQRAPIRLTLLGPQERAGRVRAWSRCRPGRAGGRSRRTSLRRSRRRRPGSPLGSRTRLRKTRASPGSRLVNARKNARSSRADSGGQPGGSSPRCGRSSPPRSWPCGRAPPCRAPHNPPVKLIRPRDRQLNVQTCGVVRPEEGAGERGLWIRRWGLLRARPSSIPGAGKYGGRRRGGRVGVAVS